MKKLIAKLAKIGRALMRGLSAVKRGAGRAVRGFFGFWFGRPGGDQMAQPETVDEQADEAAPEAGQEPSLQETLERKFSGLEPQDIKDFAMADAAQDRELILKRMTPKTRAWCKGLTEEHIGTLKQADVADIKKHMSFIQMIEGLPVPPAPSRMGFEYRKKAGANGPAKKSEKQQFDDYANNRELRESRPDLFPFSPTAMQFEERQSDKLVKMREKLKTRSMVRSGGNRMAM